MSVGRFNASSLTLSGGAYVLSLGGSRFTKGVHIVPTALGTDNYGGYYLQLCEVALR